MPNAIQTLISPRPQRTKTAHLAEVKGAFNASHASFHRENGHLYITETHYTSIHPKAQGGLESESGPPPHIHLYQSEYFTVLAGTLGVAVNGTNYFLKPGDPEKRVESGARHRFWPHEGADGGKGDVVLRVRVDEYYPGGLDERFIRNIFSYTADCDTQGKSISLPQMILFLYAHDMVADIPLPIPILKAFHWFVGYVIGAWLLGYSDTYSEYYDDEVAGKDEGKKEL